MLSHAMLYAEQTYAQLPHERSHLEQRCACLALEQRELLKSPLEVRLSSFGGVQLVLCLVRHSRTSVSSLPFGGNPCTRVAVQVLFCRMLRV